MISSSRNLSRVYVVSFYAMLLAACFSTCVAESGCPSNGNGGGGIAVVDVMRQRQDGLLKAVAELDIFSGVPNPKWHLSKADAATLSSIVGRLPQASLPFPLKGLGYRGFWVRGIDSHSGKEVTIKAFLGVAKYVVEGSVPMCLEDAERQVERFLLKTAQPWLDDSLSALVETEIQSTKQQ